MKKKYFIIILVLGFCSCQREVSVTVAGPAEVDVYVAGFVSDNANPNIIHDGDGYATYWKNGSPVQLDDGYAFGGARALSIAVSGNDVYVAGYRRGLGLIGMYSLFWKNGISVDVFNNRIPYTPYELTSLVVSNNNVYMAAPQGLWGNGETATYFKNESPIYLSDGSAGSTATSIAVSGNNVYVAGVSVNGNVLSGSQNKIAKYWKNSNAINLTNGSKDAFTTSIAVSGTDVYVAGNEDSVAKYWKNGILVNLTDGSTSAEANSIAVSGTDVYVAGTQWDGNLTHNAYGYEYRNPIAKYWKNGKPVKLTDGSTWAEARSIAVSGNDVYVAGFEYDGNLVNGFPTSVAKYWKNGIPVILGDVSKYSEAYSIFLAPK